MGEKGDEGQTEMTINGARENMKEKQTKMKQKTGGEDDEEMAPILFCMNFIRRF